jgi:D-glycero-D-manno-heptose 1,7-bisphosphate phosphatase
MGTRRAVFLDRDGVLIRAVEQDGVPHPVATVADVDLLPGVAEACAQLHDEGFLLVCVTNQPDIARGTIDAGSVALINEHVRTLLHLDDVLTCPHDDADACSCRKPLPGLLLDAADRWDIDLERSVMVGDRWRDVEAGRRAGCLTVFVRHGYAEREPEGPDLVTDGLLAAVPWIRIRA